MVEHLKSPPKDDELLPLTIFRSHMNPGPPYFDQQRHRRDDTHLLLLPFTYNGTGVTAFGVTVKTCFREASVGKLSRKMSFECGNSSSLMVCCQQLRWSNNKRSWAMMSGAKASKLQKFTLNRHILYCNND